MLQTVFPSIIRSSKLHIQRQTFVSPILLPAAGLDELFQPVQGITRPDQQQVAVLG